VKFRVERDVLAEAVTWVARGLPNRPPVPVLAGVMIEASDEGTLTFSAFDYEVSARITVAAEVAEPGTALVLGRLLSDISRNLPDHPVDVATEGNKLQVTCGSTRFDLLMMPVDDYPTLPSSPAISGTIAGDAFSQAVAQVSIAADRGDTLPVLTGVRVEIEGERITLAATDRYRLASRELTWNPVATDASHVVLVPARTLSDAAKGLGALGSIEIHLGATNATDNSLGLIGFEAGQRRTTTRLLDGDFPKFIPVLPSSADTVSVIETNALVAAVKRVALVAERNTAVRLRFTDGQVAIDAGSGDGAQASEAVEAVLTGPELEAAFNPQYFLEGLGALGTAYSRLWFNPDRKPWVLSGQAELDGDPDTSYSYILMPIRAAG
jgi:DNA polymerase III subunit beta